MKRACFFARLNLEITLLIACCDSTTTNSKYASYQHIRTVQTRRRCLHSHPRRLCSVVHSPVQGCAKASSLTRFIPPRFFSSFLNKSGSHQVLMADAPQVNYAGPWPGNDQHRQQWETAGSAENKSKEAALVDQDAYITPSKRRTILGLRRRNFWVLCILAMILVGAIVGGSVGGVSAVQRQNNR